MTARLPFTLPTQADLDFVRAVIHFASVIRNLVFYLFNITTSCCFQYFPRAFNYLNVNINVTSSQSVHIVRRNFFTLLCEKSVACNTRTTQRQPQRLLSVLHQAPHPVSFQCLKHVLNCLDKNRMPVRCVFTHHSYTSCSPESPVQISKQC